MLRFERFRLKIEAENYATHERKTFGRDIILNKGLNIIVGENTSGKSTIAKCFYYAIGMEQLIEGRSGLDALDKSVKESFEITNAEGKKEFWEVKNSVVYVKLANTDNEHITIARRIAGDNNNAQKTVIIRFDDSKAKEKKEFFLQARGDHNPPNGFYHLLAQFAGLDIQEVQSTGDGDTLLYMQIVFALSFIEQSRGWTDFFATMRTMNVFRAKQTLVEYALSVSADTTVKSRRSLLDLENPLESDPIVVLVIDPPPSFNSPKKQKQAEVTKNHSSLLCIQVFPFSKGGSLSRTKVDHFHKTTTGSLCAGIST